MRPRVPFRPVEGSDRLWTRRHDGRTEYWTSSLLGEGTVYGEREAIADDVPVRLWDPTRSKLAAALANGYDDRLPAPGETWLYLGAASGTTASHVADLVGPRGLVVAVERSVRPFARLLGVAERYPNLVPVLGDARTPEAYAAGLPPVDGLYLDVAQPDLAAIVLANGRAFLRRSGVALVVVKASGMGRGDAPRIHLARLVDALQAVGEVGVPVRLEPFHRHHYLVAVTPDRRWFGGDDPAGAPSSPRAGRAP